jgi:hypothetical protein
MAAWPAASSVLLIKPLRICDGAAPAASACSSGQTGEAGGVGRVLCRQGANRRVRARVSRQRTDAGCCSLESVRHSGERLHHQSFAFDF